jgi:hypothetical protein
MKVYLSTRIIGSKKYYIIKDVCGHDLTELLWSIKAVKRLVRQHNNTNILQWDLVQ